MPCRCCRYQLRYCRLLSTNHLQKYSLAALGIPLERPQAPQDVAPPGIGKEVVTDEGIGKVLKVNHHKHTVKVQLEAGRTIDLKWSEVALPDE